MKTLYLAHPYGGDPENLDRAKAWYSWIAWRYDCAPVADWIILCTVWTELRKDIGLTIDLELCNRCDVAALCGSMVSPGMTHETRDHRCKVDLTTLGLEYPPSSYSHHNALRHADALMAAAGIERRHHNGR